MCKLQYEIYPDKNQDIKLPYPLEGVDQYQHPGDREDHNDEDGEAHGGVPHHTPHTTPQLALKPQTGCSLGRETQRYRHVEDDDNDIDLTGEKIEGIAESSPGPVTEKVGEKEGVPQ